MNDGDELPTGQKLHDSDDSEISHDPCSLHLRPDKNRCNKNNNQRKKGAKPKNLWKHKMKKMKLRKEWNFVSAAVAGAAAAAGEMSSANYSLQTDTQWFEC